MTTAARSEMRLRRQWQLVRWMPLQTTFAYRISPGDGKKTVYAEFRDMSASEHDLLQLHYSGYTSAADQQCQVDKRDCEFGYDHVEHR